MWLQKPQTLCQCAFCVDMKMHSAAVALAAIDEWIDSGIVTLPWKIVEYRYHAAGYIEQFQSVKIRFPIVHQAWYEICISKLDKLSP